MDTQKQDDDEKMFAEIVVKKTTQVTERVYAQMSLSVQTAEKDTWQEVTTAKLKKKGN